MKKTLKIIVLMIIMAVAVITLTGCSALPKEETSVEGLAVYTADEDMTGYTKCEMMEGVEFYYPSNYISVGKETQPMFMDTEIRGASVNLISEEFPSAFSFEGYIDASIAGIKNQMTVEGDMNKEFINLNGVRAGKIEYTATSQGQTMRVTQVVIKKDQKSYILTIGSLVEDAEALQPKVDKMIKSFK